MPVVGTWTAGWVETAVCLTLVLTVGTNRREESWCWAWAIERYGPVVPALTASFHEAPHVNPRALDLHSLIQSVGVLPALSAGGVSTVSSAADRQRVDYRASLCVLSSHSTQRPVSIRVGTAGALTTFYPCRLAAGHLISHAPLGAGDTSKQCAPSTKSVRLATTSGCACCPVDSAATARPTGSSVPAPAGSPLC